MRTATKFFALLDIISILLLAKQFWAIITHINEIPDQLLSQIRVVLTLPMFLSLFLSAIGLFLFKKNWFYDLLYSIPLQVNRLDIFHWLYNLFARNFKFRRTMVRYTI